MMRNAGPDLQTETASSKDGLSDLVEDVERYKAKHGGAHHAGTLTYWPLKQIQYYLQTYFAGQQINTAETGCGASTILFSKFSAQHTVYCYDDSGSENSSVTFAKNCPIFVPENIKWVFGPTQETLLHTPPREPLDLVLIDGPHGYPFPELEYFRFWPLLKPGSIVVLDDIHIPTIGNMYRFLCQDAMFYPMRIIETTAFFQRTDVPAFDPASDGWWLQRYNVQRFEAQRGHTPKLEVPFSLDLRNGVGIRDDWLHRGFIRSPEGTYTDGMVSMMELPLEQPLTAPTRIELELEGIGLEQRPRAAVQIAVDAQVFPSETFENQARKKLTYIVDPSGSDHLSIKVHSYGLVEADDIPNFAASSFDKRLPGVFVRSIAVRPDDGPDFRWEEISNRDGTIATFRFEEQRIRFFVDQPGDSIQAHHAAGRFYEREELELIRSHAGAGARILDVGANVGNHTVFFERIMGAKLVVPVEPLPRAIELLRINALLNGLTRTDMRYLGIALSNHAEYGAFQEAAPFNLGSTAIEPGGDRQVIMLRGSDVLKGHAFDLIKIDVEGREIEVLEGLASLIDECRPTIFIEVWDRNRDRFARLTRELGYEICDEYRRYDTMTNVIIKWCST
jgi:FkbM family methyltransferase